MATEVFLALGVPVLLGLFKLALEWVRARLRPQQLQAVYDLARTAVAAAEQFGADFGADGKTKYAAAADALQDAARLVGIKLTDAETFSFIHAALKELRQTFDFMEGLPDFPAGGLDDDAQVAA